MTLPMDIDLGLGDARSSLQQSSASSESSDSDAASDPDFQGAPANADSPEVIHSRYRFSSAEYCLLGHLVKIRLLHLAHPSGTWDDLYLDLLSHPIFGKRPHVDGIPLEMVRRRVEAFRRRVERKFVVHGTLLSIPDDAPASEKIFYEMLLEQRGCFIQTTGGGDSQSPTATATRIAQGRCHNGEATTDETRGAAAFNPFDQPAVLPPIRTTLGTSPIQKSGGGALKRARTDQDCSLASAVGDVDLEVLRDEAHGATRYAAIELQRLRVKEAQLLLLQKRERTQQLAMKNQRLHLQLLLMGRDVVYPSPQDSPPQDPPSQNSPPQDPPSQNSPLQDPPRTGPLNSSRLEAELGSPEGPTELPLQTNTLQQA